jgi:hypothetical protein
MAALSQGNPATVDFERPCDLKRHTSADARHELSKLNGVSEISGVLFVA